MVKFLLIAAILFGSPLARCGPLTYDFDVTVKEDGIRFAGMFTAIEGVWDDALLRTEEITDFKVTVSDGLCCLYEFVPSFPGGTPPTGGVYIPRPRFPSFTVTTQALDRGSFFIRPEFDTFSLRLRQFFLDGTELRASLSVSPLAFSTGVGIAYWDPGGIYNRDRVFQDTPCCGPYDPFSGQPPFAFDLSLRAADVPVPTTLALVGLGLASLGVFQRKRRGPLCALKRHSHSLALLEGGSDKVAIAPLLSSRFLRESAPPWASAI